jgi:hypothetical protein
LNITIIRTVVGGGAVGSVLVFVIVFEREKEN